RVKMPQGQPSGRWAGSWGDLEVWLRGQKHRTVNPAGVAREHPRRFESCHFHCLLLSLRSLIGGGKRGPYSNGREGGLRSRIVRVRVPPDPLAGTCPHRVGEQSDTGRGSGFEPGAPPEEHSSVGIPRW